MADEKPRQCKDCRAQGVTTVRPAPHVGPRCASHWRVEKKARRERAHERMLASSYGGLTKDEYDRILAYQDGRCYMCQRATGATRRLSVDHDHASGLVRGALCRPCNDILGHARDDIVFFRRGMAYLVDPPAQRLGIVRKAEEKRPDGYRRARKGA